MALRIDRRVTEGVLVECGDSRMELWVQGIVNSQPPVVVVACNYPDPTGTVLVTRMARESISIKIADVDFKIWVNRIDCYDRAGPWVRLIFDAPREVRILRDELIGRE